jgi:hypothetical protein
MMAGSAADGAQRDAPRDAQPPGSSAGALYFYGVMRTRAWFGSAGGPEGVTTVRYRDLEALVRAVAYELPVFDEANVLAHQHVVEAVMKHGTVLPGPYGVVFRGRRQLVRMMQDQYIALDEGLAFLEGNWEVRLHIMAAADVEPDAALADAAMDLYAELRRFARAAVPFPRTGRRLTSAAFLVPRSAWTEFVERAEALGTAHPEFTCDVTGPWPPYDFVRVV